MLELCTILFSVLSKIMKFYKYSKLNFIKDAPAPKKARNTRDIKNGGMQFECVNYCLLNRSDTPTKPDAVRR